MLKKVFSTVVSEKAAVTNLPVTAKHWEMQWLSDDYTESLRTLVLCSLRPAHGKQKVPGNRSSVKVIKQKVSTFYEYKQNLESPACLKVHKQMVGSSTSECIITKTLLIEEFSKASIALGELVLQFLVIRPSNFLLLLSVQTTAMVWQQQRETVQYFLLSNTGHTSQLSVTFNTSQSQNPMELI